MRTTTRQLTFIMLGLLLMTLLLPSVFALAQETTTPTEEATVTEEATATEETQAADATGGTTGEEAAEAVESARETASSAAADTETAAEATEQAGLGTMMMVIGFLAVAGAGVLLVARDRAATNDVV